METKACQNCKNNFTIALEDFEFYDKIKVPPPTFCVNCRQQRRLIWRNERTLYRRDCDLCGKNMVTIYSPDKPYKAYCIDCWWSYKWDPKSYGVDFDFTKSFFEQWRDLQIKVPRITLLGKNNVNSDYCNHANNSKNCYMCVVVFDSENVLYSGNVLPLKNSSDCYRVFSKSNENLYECIDIHDCYNCQFCYRVDNSFDCYYSYDLKGCSNCFLSYNLRNQSYCFMNQKYSKEEYFEKIKEYDLSSNKVRKELYEEWKKIIFELGYHKTPFIEGSVNCTGNEIVYCKNLKESFDSQDAEDSKFIYLTTDGAKNCYDSYHIGVNCENMYECHAMFRSSNIIASHLSYDDSNISYCDSCHNSNELFGCVGINKGSYMILNKQYEKEEYLILKEKIIEYMKKTGEYGEFFPRELSPFDYNETQAQVYMPLTREHALEKGFRWNDNMPGTFGKETIKIEDLHDSINDVGDDIINEVLICENSGRNYNIVEQELEFYRRFNIPLPRLHPNERYMNRIRIRPDRALYDCVCAVSGVPLKTGYPPNRRPKNIVSEEVYKKEIY